MRRLFFLSFFWCIAILQTFAAPVSVEDAREIAKDFFLRQMKSGTRMAGVEPTRVLTGVVDEEDAGVFVFNSDDGFVIVSADDRTSPIFGYSTNGIYDAANVPPSLKVLLIMYDESVRSFTRSGSVTKHAAVSPLIRTRWNQLHPYNMFCPEIEKGDSRCATGCAATAMAQIMCYHQYPVSYEWSKMKNSYTGEEDGTDESAAAVAQLMADCGSALFMDYDSESSAYNFMFSEAFRNGFGYNPSVEYVDRQNYSTQSWDALLYHEISNHRPVMYSAQSVSDGHWSGHSFVIDGYDGDGYYHVNWGWGGFSDGYYLISVLNPIVQGTGGNAGTSGYSFGQAAIINIEPTDTPIDKTTRLVLNSCTLKDGKDTYKRSSTSDNFPQLTFNVDVMNLVLPSEDRSYDVEFALYKGNEKVKVLDSGSFKFNYGLDRSSDLLTDPVSLGKDLADGTYQVRFLCKEKGTKDMVWAMCSIDKYVELKIDGLTMTVKECGNIDYPMENQFEVNSLKVSENSRQGKQMVITANVTNLNNYSNPEIYLWGNTDQDNPSLYKLITAAGTYLDAEETGDVVLTFTPQRTGTFKFILTGYGGDEAGNHGTAYSTFEVEVGERSTAAVVMAVEYEVEGAVKQSNGSSKMPGQMMKGVMKVTNNGTETYDYHLDLYIQHNKQMKGTYTYYNVQSTPVVIPVNKTVEVPFRFDALDIGYYRLRLFAVENGNQILIGESNAESVFVVSNTTDIDAVMTEDHSEADVYSLNGVYLGKASDLNNLPKGLYIINNKKIINK